MDQKNIAECLAKLLTIENTSKKADEFIVFFFFYLYNLIEFENRKIKKDYRLAIYRC